MRGRSVGRTTPGYGVLTPYRQSGRIVDTPRASKSTKFRQRDLPWLPRLAALGLEFGASSGAHVRALRQLFGASRALQPGAILSEVSNPDCDFRSFLTMSPSGAGADPPDQGARSTRSIPRRSTTRPDGNGDGHRRRARARTSSRPATSPAPMHVPRGYLESRIEGAAPDRDAARDPLLRRRATARRSAAHTLSEELGYENVESMTGGITLWKDRGYEVEVPRVAHRRAARALLAPPADPRGRPRGPAEAARREGAAARRRRARLADRALPRGGRRRHARHRRRRRRRPLEPPAPGDPHDRPHRRAEGRLGRGDDQRDQPRRRRSSSTRRASTPPTSWRSSRATT